MTKFKLQFPPACWVVVKFVVKRGAGRMTRMRWCESNSGMAFQHPVFQRDVLKVSAQMAVENHGSGIDAMVNAQAFANLVSNMNGATTPTRATHEGRKVECSSVNITLKGTRTGELPKLEVKDAKEMCALTGEALIRGRWTTGSQNS